MLKIAHPTDAPGTVAGFMVMRCGNCRRLARKGFVVNDGPPGERQRAIDEASLELWGDFACEACDYDRAYVLAIGFEPPSGVSRRS